MFFAVRPTLSRSLFMRILGHASLLRKLTFGLREFALQTRARSAASRHCDSSSRNEDRSAATRALKIKMSSYPRKRRPEEGDAR